MVTTARAVQNPAYSPSSAHPTSDTDPIQFSEIFDRITGYAAGRPTNVVNPEMLELPRV